jgi:hypothetical protein
METLQKKIELMKLSINEVELCAHGINNIQKETYELALKLGNLKEKRRVSAQTAHNLRSEILTDIGHLPKEERAQYLEMLK